MAFYSSTRRTEEVHVSTIRVFKQSSVVPQQQHDHDSKPETWFVLHVATCTCFVDQVRGSIGSTTTFDKKPFRFDLNTLSSSLSLELFANSIAQETGLVSRENCGLFAKEISDVLLTKFKFSKDAIYGTTTSLAILVQVSRAVLEELDQTDFVATPTDHGFLSDQLQQGNLVHVVVAPDNVGSTETANSDHEDQQENDPAVVIVPAIILGTEISSENNEVPAPTGWDIETSMDEEHVESSVFSAHTAGRGITSSTDEDQENDHADRSELTSFADDEEQQDHAVATSTALNKTSAGDQEQVNHVVAAPTSPGEEQENHVHDAFANEEEEEEERNYDIYDDSVGVEERDYDVYSSGSEEEEEERDYDIYNDSGEEEDDDEMESLDSSLDVFDDRFFDNDDDDLIGDGPEGYEEAVAFEVIVGDDCRNVIESNDPCSICLEGYSSCGIEVAKTHCGHMFHKHCITKWLAMHMTCPFCRSSCIALV